MLLKFLLDPWMWLVANEADAGAGGGGGDGAGGGAGDAAGDKAGGEGDKGAGDGKAGGDGAGGEKAKPPAPYRPEGLADTYAGKTDQETIDKLWGDIANRPKAPENAEGYALTVTDALKGVIDPANDTVLPIYAKAALKHGLTQEQYQGIVEDVYGGMAEAGLIQQPVNPDDEFRKLSDGRGDPAAQIQKGQERVLTYNGDIDGLVARKHLTEAEGNALKEVIASADHLLAMEKVLALLPKEGGVRSGGQAGAGAPERTPHEKALRSMYPSHFKD